MKDKQKKIQKKLKISKKAVYSIAAMSNCPKSSQNVCGVNYRTM